MFILLLLLIRPQLKYLAKIEERHLSGRELQYCDVISSVISAEKNIAVPPYADLKQLTKQHKAYNNR